MTIPRASIIIARWLVLFVLAIAILYFAPLYMPIKTTHDIDVNSGRLRTRSYVLRLVRYEKIEGTIISEHSGFNDEIKADWRCVGTEQIQLPEFIPQVKVHKRFKYEVVPRQIRFLQRIWDDGGYSAQARKDTAIKLLSAWKLADTDREGMKYLLKLSDGASSEERGVGPSNKD